jgi:hypothetical protein
MIEVETVDAASTIRLLESIEAFYPMLVHGSELRLTGRLG